MPNTTAFSRIQAIGSQMWKEEGFRSFYKGITPRVLRVAPGQAVVFAVYERVSGLIDKITHTGEGSTFRWDEIEQGVRVMRAVMSTSVVRLNT